MGQDMKQSLKTFAAVLLCTGITILFCYCCYICYCSSSVYLAIKQKTRGWVGKVHQLDDQLGFAPIPGASGAHVFPVGPDIPMKYDKNGFRAPVDEKPDGARRPVFLFLGCSYTYGDACRAEDTFAYLVGKHFNGTALNAGVCGYGLTQMQILAERLIPQYRPDFVIVQCSDWLVNRATREFSPTYFLNIPYPYYADNGKDFTIVPPVYRSWGFDKDISCYRTTPAGVADFLSYMSTVAVPIQIHENMHSLAFLLKKAAGKTQRPTERKQEALNFCYTQIDGLCKKYSATMIILGLKHQSYTIVPGFFYENAEEGLKNQLAAKADYEKTYAHWRGDPPVKVDNHPNPVAHKIIAGQLIKKITGLRGKNQAKSPARQQAE